MSETIELFSKERLKSYKSEKEHIDNFLLIKALAPKLGMIEIITRNKVAKALNISDATFVSRQSFGFYITLMNAIKIHKKVANFNPLDFRKYPNFNIKYDFREYQKIKVAYSLLLTIRNRAFHFENLLKTKDKAPRITTILNGVVVGIDPLKIESFCDDILECFKGGLSEYLSGAQGAPLITREL